MKNKRLNEWMLNNLTPKQVEQAEKVSGEEQDKMINQFLLQNENNKIKKEKDKIKKEKDKAKKPIDKEIKRRLIQIISGLIAGLLSVLFYTFPDLLIELAEIILFIFLAGSFIYVIILGCIIFWEIIGRDIASALWEYRFFVGMFLLTIQVFIYYGN